ncbi:hypothetical protein SprV_0602132800 [Sparganum proliferum]
MNNFHYTHVLRSCDYFIRVLIVEFKVPSTTATDASPITTKAPDTSAYTSESQTTHSTEQATSTHTSESQTTHSTGQASPTHTDETQATDPKEQVPATQNTGEPTKAIADLQPALWDLGTALGYGVGADENEVTFHTVHAIFMFHTDIV